MWSHAVGVAAPLSGPRSGLCCQGHLSRAWCHHERCQCSWHHLCGLGIACKSQQIKGLDNGSVLNIEDIQEYAVHKRKYLKRRTWQGSGCGGPKRRCFHRCSRRSTPWRQGWWLAHSRPVRRRSARLLCGVSGRQDPKWSECWPPLQR